MNRNQLKPMRIGQSVEYMTRTRNYQPVGVLATDTGREFVVTCSRDADPARWCVIGRLFDVTFLTHRELEDFILERNLHEWTEEDDRKFGKNLSNYCKAYNAVF